MALRRACIVGTVISLIGGVAGILIMLALSYLGRTELLTPARILLYQLAWMIPTWLATEWTRVVWVSLPGALRRMLPEFFCWNKTGRE